MQFESMRSEIPKTSSSRPRLLTSALVVLSLVMLGTGPADGRDRSPASRPSRAERPLPAANFAVVKNAVADPVGDTLGTSTPQIDITSLAARRIGNELVIELSFATPIDPPSSNLPNAIDGFIDVDADQDGSTGRVPWVDALTGVESTGMGNEYYVDLLTWDPLDGAVDLVKETNEVTIGRVPATFGAHSLRISIPLALIANDDAVNVAAAIGTQEELPCDIAPNHGSVSSVRPETAFTLGEGRFSVEITWKDFEGKTGMGKEVVGSRDSAVAYFFNPDNWEVLVKALDGCAVNGHWWIFLSASTNVEYTVSVTDTKEGATWEYVNPLGEASPAVVDTEAFATCP